MGPRTPLPTPMVSSGLLGPRGTELGGGVGEFGARRAAGVSVTLGGRVGKSLIKFLTA